MGGFIALQLALRYPHLVTHLVLVAATGGVDMAGHGASDWRHDYDGSTIVRSVIRGPVQLSAWIEQTSVVIPPPR